MFDFNAFTTPMTKLIELNKAQFEKIASAQQSAIKNYVELSEERFNAALNIKDGHSLNTFNKEQTELMQSGIDKMMAESKQILENSKTYNEQVLNIVKESTSAFNPQSD